MSVKNELAYVDLDNIGCCYLNHMENIDALGDLKTHLAM